MMHPVRYVTVEALAVVLAAALAASVMATPITTGDVLLTGAPDSVVEGQTESNTDLLLFGENTLTLAEPLAVDITDPGGYDDPENVSEGFIGAGTAVRTFMVHFDTVGSNLVTGRSGSATFGTDILGIILFSESLDSTDALLGNPTTTYPAAGANDVRGIELDTNPARDMISLSSDRRTLTLDRVGVETGPDQLRVVLDIPEPTGLACLLLPAMAMFRRR